MKGIIFTEFIEMVETQFGIDVAQTIIDNANLQNAGAYTAVGTYPQHEMVQLITELHKKTTIPITELMLYYGRYLFKRLANLYPQLISKATSSFDLLDNLDTIIHSEVRKLYPDSNPPVFTTVTKSENQITIIYNSKRSFGEVAEGLINGCGDYYNEHFLIEKKVLAADGSIIEFMITKI